MNNKTNKQIAPLFANPILDQNSALNNKPISHKKMLELYLKGIKLYDQNLSSFKSNAPQGNNKKLILSLRKGTFSNLDLNTSNPIINTVNNINAPHLIEGTKVDETETNNLTSSPVNEIRINKYLKAISLLNSKTKGQVINYSDNISYNFISANNKLIKNIYTLLEYSFFSMSSLISKPVFEITPEKVVIHLYFFVFNKGSVGHVNNFINKTKKNIGAAGVLEGNNIKDSNTFLISNSNKLNKICDILSGYFKKPVELELVRLYYPYFNSNILVNLLGLIINKIKVRFITKKLFKKAIIKNPTKLSRKNRLTIIPSFLSGIKIRIAGRLLTHRVVPRKTIKTIRRGALARGKVNFLDIARFTNKNKRGAFSITISSGQNFS
jgi:ribosomal VAR1-like protein